MSVPFSLISKFNLKNRNLRDANKARREAQRGSSEINGDNSWRDARDKTDRDGGREIEREREREKDTYTYTYRKRELLTTLRCWSWAPSADPTDAAGNRARRSRRSPSPVGRLSWASSGEACRVVWRCRHTMTGSASRRRRRRRRRPASASSRRSIRRPCSSWTVHQRAPPPRFSSLFLVYASPRHGVPYVDVFADACPIAPALR